MRLVTRSEFAERIQRVKRSSVYNHCKEGKPLYAAMCGGDMIDLDHRNAQMYCAKHGYKEPNVAQERAKAREAERAKMALEPTYDTQQIQPEEHEDLEELDAVQYADLSLRDIVRRHGKLARFKELVAAYKILVSTQQVEEKMARDRKEFAHFSHIERLAMHIDGLHKMLLSDASKSIADTAQTLIKAGASDVEVRKAVTKVLEQTIRMAKSSSDQIIRSAKS